MATVLWLALGLLAFSYVGYPLALVALGAIHDLRGALRFLAGGPDRRGEREPREWPRVSVVLAAYDEETCIRAKIENCLALDYPPERLEVVLGCDGCTDRTAEIARHAGRGRVRVVELSPRQGKASVLGRLVPAASGDVVVLTDANVTLHPGAIRALARRFRDPAVGAVVGRLRFRTRRGESEGIYWAYETFLKYLEGKLGAVIGANGGIYAIRRILFGRLPADTVTDDFAVPARIAVRGWRVPFEPDALAWEDAPEDSRQEFGRRARIGAGNWQALRRLPDLLDPRAGFVSFAFLSHKLLRWLGPFLLVAALVSNVAAVAAAPGAAGLRALLAAQLLFYALAAAGQRGAGRAGRIARYFVLMNAALAVGLWRHLRGTQRAAWRRTERVAAPAGPAAHPPEGLHARSPQLP
jgi:cellulose synthase/poly-beta-1,6-N-acetylglucosamine synthase-like glycosyltransferase